MLAVRMLAYSVYIYIHVNRGIFLFSLMLHIHLSRHLSILPSVHAVIFEVLGGVCIFLGLQVFHKVIDC